MSVSASSISFAVKAPPPAALPAALPAARRFPPLAFFPTDGIFTLRKPAVLGKLRPPAASSFRRRAVADDYESGVEKTTPNGSSGSTAVVDPIDEENSDDASFTVDLKKKLIEQLYGTDRGLKATSETRAEVNELITQLEARNPNPAPTDALSLLNGKWILAYTSFSGLFPLLGTGKLPQLVKVDEISQTIDSEAFTVQNSVLLIGPFSTTSLSTNAKFEVRSPKRVQIKFEEGIIGTPQLTDSIVIPEKVELFGQNIDLSPLKGVISSLQETASSVAKTISGQPPLKIPISGSNAQSWLLTTYLDHELRISRGDGNSVFVLIKEGKEAEFITPMMKWKLAGQLKKLTDIASTSVSAYRDIHSSVEALLHKHDQSKNIVQDLPGSSQVGSTTFTSELVGISIRDPHVVRTKGRPKIASRISSGIESSQNQSKKRTCGSCGGKGHYTTTCPHKEKDLQ